MNTPIFNLRMSKELQNEVKCMAQAAGKTKSDVIRDLVIQAIQTGAQQPEHQPAASGN